MKQHRDKYTGAANILKVRNAIVQFVKEEGRIPTGIEVRNMVGLSHSRVVKIMHFIESKGWVEDFFVRSSGMHADAPNPTIMDERWAQ